MNKLLFQNIFILLLSFSFQQYNYDIDMGQLQASSIYTDMMNCINHENKLTCSSVTMTDKLYQCCTVNTQMHFSSSHYSSSSQICSIWLTIDITDDEIEALQESYQESATFISLIYGTYLPEFSLEYICPKKTYNFDYGPGDFSDEEKAIMKNENYCLRLYYQGLYQLGYVSNFIKNEGKTISKQQCMNALTLPNSKNSCAYANFNFKFADGTSVSVSTCMLVSDVSFQTKSLDQSFEKEFAKFTTLNGKRITSFETEIANKDGTTMKYDSLTKTLTGNTSSSYYLGKSLFIIYYLLIILL